MSDYHDGDGDRLAKVIARSGLCSRRDAEGWIKDGRVTVNGKKVLTPPSTFPKKTRSRSMASRWPPARARASGSTTSPPASW
jgi:16S rRNA U516 pseudouridylate synthase RsuA-like enzyme